MGIEYQHHLFVSDLSCIGTLDAAKAVTAVLARWGLVPNPPTIRSLDGGQNRKLRQTSLDKISDDIQNLLVEYPFAECDAIAQIMGPSAYGEEVGRYFQSIAIVVGSDFRVYRGGETCLTRIKAAPTRRGEIVAPYPVRMNCRYWDHVYPADADTTPPIASLERDKHDWPLPKSFSGIWRCGLILDCGKDLPDFMEKSNELPSADFAADIEAAFSRPIVQVGYFY